MACVWVLGFVLILTVGRGQRVQEALPERRRTLADHLRELIESVGAGTATQAELTNLERGLLGYWRKKLRLENLSSAEVLSRLHEHPDSGPLLKQLEIWL